MQLDNKGRLNMWTDINITDKYRDLEIDANKLFDHGILTEEYDKDTRIGGRTYAILCLEVL